jgi:type I restriction enzyme S subunit
MIADLKPYAEYRDSGLPWLGRVPGHWDMRPAFGAFVPNHESNHGMKEKTVLSLSYGRIVIKPVEKLHGLVPESFETYQIVNPGDIVLRTTDLQNDHTSLRVGMVRDRGIITSAYLALRVNAGVSPEFGFQFVNVWDSSKAIYGYGSGLRQNLDFSHFKRMPVAVPPPAEQAAIVRFLDWANGRLERAIRAKRKVIALLNEQKQAIIHRAVTRGLDPSVPLKPSGIPWLGDIPQHWEVRPFVRCTIERGDYRGATPEKVESGVFLVTAKNVRKGWIDYETSKEYVRASEYSKIMRRGLPKKGDVLLTMEAPLGHIALIDREDIALAQRIIRFRLHPGRLLPEFALLCLNSAYFQNQLHERATGSTAQGLKASKLPQLLVALPVVSEQDKIVEQVMRECMPADTVISRLEREIELLREYRIRLVADVVTGKLDVREAAARVPDAAAPDIAEDDTDVSDEIEAADVEAAV